MAFLSGAAKCLVNRGERTAWPQFRYTNCWVPSGRYGSNSPPEAAGGAAATSRPTTAADTNLTILILAQGYGSDSGSLGKYRRCRSRVVAQYRTRLSLHPVSTPP